MGRRRGKKTVFLQSGTLEAEAGLNICSDDEPGGLHIGGSVVYRAPLSTRRGSRLPGGRQLPGCSSLDAYIQGPAQLQEQEAAAPLYDESDGSLGDELKDYLVNIEQHDGSDNNDSSSIDAASDAADEPELAADDTAEAALQVDGSRTVAATEAAAGRMTREGSIGADSHPGLGYHPGLGFRDMTAAARFTAVGLDDALEGVLGWDMAAGQQRDPTTSSYRDGGSTSNQDSSSSSSSGSDIERCWRGGLGTVEMNPAAAAVVDAQGRPIALWEQLTLQQRFPVLTRQQQQGLPGTAPQSAAGRSTSNRSRSKNGGMQQTPKRQITRVGDDSSLSMIEALLSSMRMPRFSSTAAATAAASACKAAAAAAADKTSGERQQERRQQRAAVKGAQGGQLLPGEKKMLRKKKIAAKRAVRQAAAGAGALELLAIVEEFVAAGGDMIVLPPTGKHKQAFTRALASLYGAQATACGGSSSSGKISLVLQRTCSMSLLGENDAHGLAQLETLLTAEMALELTAAVTAANLAPRAKRKEHKRRSPHQAGHKHPGGTGAAGDMRQSMFQQPLSFVPGGILDPNSMHDKAAAVDVAQLQRGAAAASATADNPDARHMTGQQLAIEGPGIAAADDGPNTERSTAKADHTHLEPLLQESDEQQVKDPPGHGQLQQQQQQSDQMVGNWMIDRQPLTAAAVVELEPAAAAVAGDDAPMYDRAPLGLGCSGTGVVYGLDSAQVARSQNVLGAADGCAGSSGRQKSSSRALQELEDKFSNLRAVTSPHAARAQQRTQQQQQQQHNIRHHQQQQQERRLLNPNTALGPSAAGVVVAPAVAPKHMKGGGSLSTPYAEECHMNLNLGLTAQQVKKAKKQQQRNERREARAAAAAADEMQVSTEVAASGAGNMGNSFAAFEAHTTGIGSRLLGRWGWSEGQGLGRARHGRAEPLQAARRPRQLGLGAE